MTSRFTRHFKEAFWGMIRHGGMTFSSIIAVTITLVMVSILLMITLNLAQLASIVQSEVQIYVGISNNANQTSITTLGNRIGVIQGVAKLTFSDKDNELDKFIASYGPEGQIFEIYRGENNPLKNAYIIEIAEGYDIAVIADQINAFENVDTVDYGGENTVKLINFMNAIRDGGLLLVLILGSLAVFLVANTIKITIQARYDEIQILRILGATNHFIRMPMVIEGFMIGLLGAILPIVFTIQGYQMLHTAMNGVVISSLFVLRPVYPFVLQISYLLAILGIVVGLSGSFISVTRYLWGKK
jgi:cell division transport system permease protein